MQYNECNQLEIEIQLHPLPRIMSAEERSTMFEKKKNIFQFELCSNFKKYFGA